MRRCHGLDPWRRAPLRLGILAGLRRQQFRADGVVLVTINYRLGLLGYFAHPALTKAAWPDAPLGNYGDMDQLAALEMGSAQYRSLRRRSLERHRVRRVGRRFEHALSARHAGGERIVRQGDRRVRRRLERGDHPAAEGKRRRRIRDARRIYAGAARRWIRSALYSRREDVRHAGQSRLWPVRRRSAGDQDAGAGVRIRPDNRRSADHRLQQFRSLADEVILHPAGPHHVSPVAGSARRLRERRPVGHDTRCGDLHRFGHGRAGALDRPQGSGRRAVLALSLSPTSSSMRRATSPGAAHGSEIPYVFGTGTALAARFGIQLSQDDLAMEHLVHSCWVGFARKGIPDCDGQTWPAVMKDHDRPSRVWTGHRRGEGLPQGAIQGTRKPVYTRIDARRFVRPSPQAQARPPSSARRAASAGPVMFQSGCAHDEANDSPNSGGPITEATPIRLWFAP